ncbi:hypothetical protein Poli38472_011189 [Pythium oligandrum]|uniref:Uncharacterized protein n=1 Tax=Pythium oligandrum TaxID=41045 RepID=A0A8K1CQ49_PYTOL|nr:hypothetical protein Poli38472_011189 [Pythium oligandrum]|eukprot:TMW67569.1 hypothetical protein Poli38472_011189 [Pythium oligandrum]
MMLSQWFAATLLDIKVRTTHLESIGIDMSWKPCDIAMLQIMRQQSDNNGGFPALLFSEDTLSRLEIMDEMSTEQVLKQLKVLAPSNVSGKAVRVLRRTLIHIGPREDSVAGASVAFPEDRVLRAVDMVDGWVSVVVPFHGIGWLAADHVEFVDGTPGLRLHPTLPLRSIRTVKLTELGANQEQFGEVLMTLGTGLQHLVLTLSSDTNLTWTTLTTIWSARLTHLRLVNASLKSFDDIVELYRLHPISSIAVLELIEPCVDDTESIIRFAQRLRDPRHPMTKRLRELQLRHTDVYRGGKIRQLTRRHLKEFQDMLKVNKTLRHLDLEVNLRLLSEFQSEFLEYHDEQLPVSSEVIAFISVVAADNTPIAGVLRRVETGVLRHILTFTLESRRRSVYLRKLGEKI